MPPPLSSSTCGTDDANLIKDPEAIALVDEITDFYQRVTKDLEQLPRLDGENDLEHLHRISRLRLLTKLHVDAYRAQAVADRKILLPDAHAFLLERILDLSYESWLTSSPSSSFKIPSVRPLVLVTLGRVKMTDIRRTAGTSVDWADVIRLIGGMRVPHHKIISVNLLPLNPLRRTLQDWRGFGVKRETVWVEKAIYINTESEDEDGAHEVDDENVDSLPDNAKSRPKRLHSSRLEGKVRAETQSPPSYKAQLDADIGGIARSSSGQKPMSRPVSSPGLPSSMESNKVLTLRTPSLASDSISHALALSKGLPSMDNGSSQHLRVSPCPSASSAGPAVEAYRHGCFPRSFDGSTEDGRVSALKQIFSLKEPLESNLDFTNRILNYLPACVPCGAQNQCRLEHYPRTGCIHCRDMGRRCSHTDVFRMLRAIHVSGSSATELQSTFCSRRKEITHCVFEPFAQVDADQMDALYHLSLQARPPDAELRDLPICRGDLANLPTPAPHALTTRGSNLTETRIGPSGSRSPNPLFHPSPSPLNVEDQESVVHHVGLKPLPKPDQSVGSPSEDDSSSSKPSPNFSLSLADAGSLLETPSSMQINDSGRLQVGTVNQEKTNNDRAPHLDADAQISQLREFLVNATQNMVRTTAASHQAQQSFELAASPFRRSVHGDRSHQQTWEQAVASTVATSATPQLPSSPAVLIDPTEGLGLDEPTRISMLRDVLAQAQARIHSLELSTLRQQPVDLDAPLQSDRVRAFSLRVPISPNMPVSALQELLNRERQRSSDLQVALTECTQNARELGMRFDHLQGVAAYNQRQLAGTFSFLQTVRDRHSEMLDLLERGRLERARLLEENQVLRNHGDRVSGLVQSQTNTITALNSSLIQLRSANPDLCFRFIQATLDSGLSRLAALTPSASPGSDTASYVRQVNATLTFVQDAVQRVETACSSIFGQKELFSPLDNSLFAAALPYPAPLVHIAGFVQLPSHAPSMLFGPFDGGIPPDRRPTSSEVVDHTMPTDATSGASSAFGDGSRKKLSSVDGFSMGPSLKRRCDATVEAEAEEVGGEKRARTS